MSGTIINEMTKKANGTVRDYRNRLGNTVTANLLLAVNRFVPPPLREKESLMASIALFPAGGTRVPSKNQRTGDRVTDMRIRLTILIAGLRLWRSAHSRRGN